MEKELAPRKDIQENDQSMIKNVLHSGIKVLAANDRQLNEEQKRRVMEAVEGEEQSKEAVVESLKDMANQIDILVDSISDIDKCLKEDDSGEKLSQYVMDIAKKIFQPDLSIGRVMVVVMMGYGIIRKFVKLFNSVVAIVNFIGKIAKLIYDVFEKFGVIQWINAIGGWGAAALNLSATKLNTLLAGLSGQ